MKINKDKSWLLFYVAAALMLGVLMMACSSDEGNYVLVSTEEANSTLNSLANYPN